MTSGPEYIPPSEPPRAETDPVLPPPFGEAPSTRGVLVLYGMMLLGMVLVGGVAQFFLGFAANALLTECIVVAGPIWFLLRRVNPAKALHLHRAPDTRLLAWAVLGVLSLAVLLAEFTHWSDLVFPMPDSVKVAYLNAVTADSFSELLVLLLAAAIVPGLCEETAFRGFFQRVAVSRFGTPNGVAMAAVLFAVMHLDPWHMIALFLIGLYLGYVYEWTGNLWIAAAAHAANNAASVVLLYLAPEGSLSQISEPPPRWLLPFALVALVWSLRQLSKTAAAWPARPSPPHESYR